MKVWIRLLRVNQYVKNLVVFFPLFFAGKILDTSLLEPAILAFLSFCLSASAVYIFNDTRDVLYDREHPKKKFRPIASGEIHASKALKVAFLLCVFGILLGYQVSLDLVSLLLVYLVINLAYSIVLKHIPIIDVFIVAFGFWLRLLAGSLASGVPLSSWIQLMTFLLAFFMALAKRRDDVILSSEDKSNTRKVVDGYSLEFLGLAMVLMGSVTIVCYIMYCFSPDVISRAGSENIVVTVIFVILGILRYMQITFVEYRSGSPVQVLYQDRFLKVVITLWLLCFVYFIYIDSLSVTNG